MDVIKIVTRGWVNQHMDSCCHLVLVGHLKGLFEDCFAGHSGLYCGNFLVVNIVFCVRDTVSGL